MTQARSVPFHSLGISQIVAYGALFYAFAQIKTPLAVRLGVGETEIMAAVTGALLLQVIIAPIAGHLTDRHGALWVLGRGLLIGALGMVIVSQASQFWHLLAAMLPVGTGFAMATYETAFAAAVQADERSARRHISLITFYGGVASSVIWLTIAPLLAGPGLEVSCLGLAAGLAAMAIRILWLARHYRLAPGARQGQRQRQGQGRAKSSKELDGPDTGISDMAPFSWRLLGRTEKQAFLCLAGSSTLEYFVFTATALLWISYFTGLFGGANAVWLASLYGPFQVVGRILEMRFGHRFDARLTGLVACAGVPSALLLAGSGDLVLAVLAMMLFGIGHGILTVSFGFVTSLYFRPAVYGRAKGWMTVPRALGTASGPALGTALFIAAADWFLPVMLAVVVLAALLFGLLLRVPVRADLPAGHG